MVWCCLDEEFTQLLCATITNTVLISKYLLSQEIEHKKRNGKGRQYSWEILWYAVEYLKFQVISQPVYLVDGNRAKL